MGPSRAVGRPGALAMMMVMMWAAAALACPGDCDANGKTNVDELLRSVGIVLGQRPVTDCSACDMNDNGTVDVAELVSAVDAALDGCPVTPTLSPAATPLPTATPSPGAVPIFPANYRNTYVEVRNCRSSIDHGPGAIRVLANPLAAEPYLDEHNPLPVGSIVVKEEYNASDCSDDTKLVRWRAMRKEEAGFDLDDGDWHWQWVNRNRTVSFDDKTTCISCHRAAACLARDYMCTVDTNEPTLPPLRVVFNGLPPALLAAVGTSATNIFVVGADPDDGMGPYVLHYNGQCWTRLKTGATGALWWISVKPIAGAFYTVGDKGLILRYDLATGEFEHQIGPGSQQLFGVWGEVGDSVWAVGGNLENESTGGVIWHYDGQSWQPVDLTSVFPSGPPMLFKVWGRNDHDVYVVGLAGTVLHYDGDGWSRVESDTNRPLFTVNGNDNLVVATGGFSDGVIVENDGTGFVDRTPQLSEQVNSVFVPPNGVAVGVGINSTMVLRGPNGWSIAETDLERGRDFHGVWLDPEGGIWAVGGDLSVDLSDGMLVYGGNRTIATEIRMDTGSRCGDGSTIQ